MGQEKYNLTGKKKKDYLFIPTSLESFFLFFDDKHLKTATAIIT